MRKAILLALLTTFVLTSFVNAETVKIATGEWAPFVSQKMEGYGCSGEIVVAAFKAAGLEYKIEFLPWKRALARVEQGKADCSFPLSKTPERQAYADYSEPFQRFQTVFFYRKSQFPNGIEFKALADLKEYKIGAPLGYSFEMLLRNAGLNIEWVTNAKNNFNKLEKGRVDLVPEGTLVGMELIKAAFPGKEAQFAYTTDTIQDDELHVIFSKANAKSKSLREKFNKGLAKIKANGVHAGILAKYGLK